MRLEFHPEAELELIEAAVQAIGNRELTASGKDGDVRH
jgi:hypothetical protein